MESFVSVLLIKTSVSKYISIDDTTQHPNVSNKVFISEKSQFPLSPQTHRLAQKSIMHLEHQHKIMIRFADRKRFHHILRSTQSHKAHPREKSRRFKALSH